MLHPVRAAAAVASVLVVGAAGVVAFVAVPATAEDGAVASAELKDADGKVLGKVSFYERGGSTRVETRGDGMPPGFHGFHVHEFGVCEPPDFTSAGGHFRESDQSHRDHDGDLPVLLVKRSGITDAAVWTDRFSVADVRGKAMIVHTDPDNYANIPPRYGGPDDATKDTGDAGGRIACGVIE